MRVGPFSSLEEAQVALTVVVLAAGQGKRMNSDLPKVLQALAGQPLLAHVLDTAETLAPDAIIVVYGHGGKRVRETFPERSLEWVLQSEQLGTGHALKQALPSIRGDRQVLVLCGDAPLVRPASLKALLACTPADAIGVLTAKLADPSGYGRILRDADGQVTGVVEEREASAEQRAIDEINTGVMVLPASWLNTALAEIGNDNAQGEYYLTDVIAAAVRQGRTIVTALAEDAGEILGINDRLQLAVAERVLQRRYAEDLLTKGATLADPARFDLRGELEVGKDVFIDVGAVFIGRVALGDRVRIGPNAVISESRLGSDSVVHAHCVLDGIVAGPRCEIGPYARLRPGTNLAGRVKVGNFVEVKASDVAEGSKMNHLSYVGDSRVGKDVNIGAGTITCNYDGAAKHRTDIGDRVFVGSGVMLVAPVVLGDDCTIGAGSTISKRAPAGELTIARAHQTTIKGWKRPRKEK
jgi:bifunctional UDP-N-acetylglucosamine pyrophosphorylase/glucosamine-1-phosphate N-acetyltransferase